MNNSMLKMLKNLAREINTAPSLEASLRIIVQRISSGMQVQVCSLFLWNNETREYRLMATEGLNNASIGKSTLGANEGIISVVGKREEPINLADASKHPAFAYIPELGEDKYKAFLAAPIMHQRRLLGVLVVQREEAKRFDEQEEALLSTVSIQLASLIMHAEATGGLNDLNGNQTKKVNRMFAGVAGANGVAIGECVVIGPAADLDEIPILATKDTEAELLKFQHAIESVRGDIRRAGEKFSDKLRPEEQALFNVYLSMLDDNALGNEVATLIKEGYQAQGALAQTIRQYEQHFEAMDDEYLRERAADIRDLGRRILSYLLDQAQIPKRIPANAILIGDELTPAILGEVAGKSIAGIVSVKGSANSHIAILARAMGIPTVMGVLDMPFRQLEGKELVVDGYRGHVYVDLSPEKLQYFELIVEEEKTLVAGLERYKGLPCTTQDGTKISLMVNTGLMTDVVRSLDRGAEGVGLYRTEVPFMMRDRFPSESEQTDIYRQQLQAFAPLPVTMRTLDIGGDKCLPYFPINEENPFLGWRGIRVTLDHPEIFLVQLRAMIKGSEGSNNLRIMLPMITTVTELDESLQLIHRVVHELQDEGYQIITPKIGIMIEVPAVLYQIKEFASRIDFMSVGSNDLTQYLLAVDRNNPRVADLYDSFHPAVLNALAGIIRNSREHDIDISICGEVAGDPSMAVLLIAMGYTVLSMNSTNLLKVKSVLRQVDQAWTHALLQQVLPMDNALLIRSEVELALQSRGISLTSMTVAHGRQS